MLFKYNPIQKGLSIKKSDSQEKIKSIAGEEIVSFARKEGLLILTNDLSSLKLLFVVYKAK